ncbi:MAG: NAD metabolism ATPase/kinase [Cytophagaceae bacterium SCN 52-12]|mgnify:CR=1 FL=1|nr:MAG: NAD metabolism ATPase/kinase [Cytophagaceae bacterium SCN 52-12]
MFEDKDLEQITRRGSDIHAVNTQVKYFVDGFPYLRLEKAARVADGIIRLAEEEAELKMEEYDRLIAGQQLTPLKFVPASGAASRMFKSLFSFLDNGKTDSSVEEFFDKLGDFAFYDSLKQLMATDGIDIDSADRHTIAEYFLTDKGLGYGTLPKGLLEFHRSEPKPRTPLEEHLVEAIQYASSGGTALLHFTVSPEHRDKFEKLVVERLPHYESNFETKFYISFSEQLPATDTISVNPDNTPFREPDGSLLFRPAGHGALLANLGELDADIIFIKNIDNVVPDSLKQTTIKYKKVLAAILLDYQKRIFDYQARLEEGVTTPLLRELDAFYRDELCTIPPEDFESRTESEQADYFRKKLNRPVRVCGMVKNQGEPGGGPFWARNRDGSTSLQVVESAQVDLADEEQKAIWVTATHFNPVDLVIATKDANGNLYNLDDFRDPDTGFISSKSKDGKELKAQELPGLWNGSMSDWNTLFVEVPLITFNPVKTVNDLLREQHQ